MKIIIDISRLHSFSKQRGIGFYTKNLFDSLKKYPEVEVELKEDENLGQGDIIHYPYFDLFKRSLPFSKKIPSVVTVHDVIPLIFSDHYPPGVRGSINLYFQKLALKSAKAIITDSDNSKKDIVKYLGISPDRVFRVYLAPASHFKVINNKEIINKILKKYKLPAKFFIYTGSVNWNKNILNIAQAAINAEIDIVFVGKGFENKDNLDHPEMRDFKEFRLKYLANPKVHILGFVPDEDLVALLNASLGLLLASRYEGFGLPILEAQSCGTAVITGNNSSMTEVAGEGAILVDPNNLEEMTKAMVSISNDGDFRKKLIEKGRNNLKRFSWEKTAKDTVEVYKYALQK